MWRQMFRILPKNLNHICTKTAMQKANGWRRILLHSAFLMSTAHVIVNQIANDETLDESCSDELNAPITDIDELQLAADIETTYAESGEALHDLIKTLHACIQEICDQYQHCIARQIEIMLQCMNMEPVGSHWDEMTKYRVIADDLRVEFMKYRTLAYTIGSIVKNERYKQTDNSKPKDGKPVLVGEAYKELVDLIEQKSQENKTWDSKLVDVHTRSIVTTDTKKISDK